MVKKLNISKAKAKKLDTVINKMTELIKVSEEFVGDGCKIVMIIAPDTNNHPDRIAMIQNVFSIEDAYAMLNAAVVVQATIASEHMDSYANTEGSNTKN